MKMPIEKSKGPWKKGKKQKNNSINVGDKVKLIEGSLVWEKFEPKNWEFAKDHYNQVATVISINDEYVDLKFEDGFELNDIYIKSLKK